MSARPVPPGDFGALTGAEQLTAIPRSPADIPAGRVVVHNHVRPARRLGMRGFRAYLVQPGPLITACGCGWAPELGTHYRVVRNDAAPPS